MELTSSTSADEPQIIELRNLILHESSGITQFRTAVLIIARSNCHQCPITNVTERYYLERNWKSLVGSPVVWENCADYMWATCKNRSFERIIGDDQSS